MLEEVGLTGSGEPLLHAGVEGDLRVPPLDVANARHFAICTQTLDACLTQLSSGPHLPLNEQEYAGYAAQGDRLMAFQELVASRGIDLADSKTQALVQSLAFSIPRAEVLTRQLENGPKALVLDSDGVIVDTPRIHVALWKRMILEQMAQLPRDAGVDCGPLTDEEHTKYITGTNRYAGLGKFLRARGLAVTDDDPLVHEWADLKAGYYEEAIKSGAVPTYPSTVELIKKCREEGVLIAVASSSKFTAGILLNTGVMEYVDVVVDGHAVKALGLRDKPMPDIFTTACRRLGVDPKDAAGFEDAASGLAALVNGGFGAVVALAREHDEATLAEEGPTFLVTDLSEMPSGGLQQHFREQTLS